MRIDCPVPDPTCPESDGSPAYGNGSFPVKSFPGPELRGWHPACIKHAVDKPRTRRHAILRVILPIAACLGTAGILVYLFAFHDTGADMVVRDGELAIGRVVRGPFREYVDVQAVAVPSGAVAVEAKEAGTIVDIRAEEGDPVRRGQTVLVLDNPVLRAEMAEAESRLAEDSIALEAARLEMAQAACSMEERVLDLDRSFETAGRDLARGKVLLAAGGAARADVEEAETGLEWLRRKREILDRTQAAQAALLEGRIRLAQSALETQRRTLELLRGRIRRLEIAAEADGRLTGMEATLGRSVRAGEQIARIETPTAARLSARVDEWYLPKVSTDGGASVDYDGKGFPLRIQKVLPTIRDGTFGIEMAFTGEPPKGLRSGQGFTARIALSAEGETLLLPKGPFYGSTGGSWVFALLPDGRTAARRSIRCGRSNPESVEVLAGLEEGDRVILSDYAPFLDRERIELR